MTVEVNAGWKYKERSRVSWERNVRIWSVKLGRRCAPSFREHSKKPKLLHDRSAVICASLPPLTILLIDMHVSLLERAKCMWPNPRIPVDTKLFRSTHETPNSTTFHSVSASPSRFSVLLIPTLNPQYPLRHARSNGYHDHRRHSTPPTLRATPRVIKLQFRGDGESPIRALSCAEQSRSSSCSPKATLSAFARHAVGREASFQHAPPAEHVVSCPSLPLSPRGFLARSSLAELQDSKTGGGAHFAVDPEDPEGSQMRVGGWIGRCSAIDRVLVDVLERWGAEIAPRCRVSLSC